ncbi:MAG: hypothetical protein LBQ50_12845 [Planctomycetaceae bacterium]|jgi:hypothetical protein|nr:hypothetical protein [Planctomycetaceae bacterium]
MIDWLFDVANPVFALTVRMKNCRKIFFGTLIAYCLVLFGIIISAILFPPPIFGFSPTDFFEVGFLAATCCTVVFLGSDFGTVFIESTFQDELLRLTPLTPLQIVHGGFCSGFFFSFGLLCPAFLSLAAAFFLHFPVERLFWGILLLFLIGQALNLVLLSYYIHAQHWREIGFGASTIFLLIILFGGFCFTELGGKLVDPVFWKVPMTFLFVVALLMLCLAYILARNHACHPKRSFFQTVLINLVVYIPFLILVCAAVIFMPQ